jgi:endonuclease YncB( thermonuclease family)
VSIGMLFSIFCVGILATSTINAAELNGKPKIIDGDTIDISDHRVRLHGIDAPEIRQECQKPDGADYPCGVMAKDALAELIEEHWVKCVGNGNDRYRRVLATCFAGPVNLNLEMVRGGWALAYRQYSKRYISVEFEAKTSQVGLWQGSFVNPWEWRRGVRLQPLASFSASNSTTDPQGSDCKIKGNISRSGNRIYHLPKGRYYANTKINSAKGERWFCSESEARKAGWRAAK